MKYIHEMNIAELEQAEKETIQEIEEQKKKPMFIQAQFGNALEARLGTIRNFLKKLKNNA